MPLALSVAIRVLLGASLALSLVVNPARAGDPAKTLRVALSIAETSFDPAFASDAASDDIIGAIFDAMLDYDYLARPVKLVPRALEALPVVEDGKVAGLISIGDVVKWRVGEYEREQEALREYIKTA